MPTICGLLMLRCWFGFLVAVQSSSLNYFWGPLDLLVSRSVVGSGIGGGDSPIRRGLAMLTALCAGANGLRCSSSEIFQKW